MSEDGKGKPRYDARPKQDEPADKRPDDAPAPDAEGAAPVRGMLTGAGDDTLLGVAAGKLPLALSGGDVEASCAGAAQTARVIASYYAAMVGYGVPDGYAASLTLAYQQVLLSAARGG